MIQCSLFPAQMQVLVIENNREKYLKIILNVRFGPTRKKNFHRIIFCET